MLDDCSPCHGCPRGTLKVTLGRVTLADLVSEGQASAHPLPTERVRLSMAAGWGRTTPRRFLGLEPVVTSS